MYFGDPKFQDFEISKFPDFQTPPAPPPDKLLDPNLSPLPTHPGVKYVAKALAATMETKHDSNKQLASKYG